MVQLAAHSCAYHAITMLAAGLLTILGVTMALSNLKHATIQALMTHSGPVDRLSFYADCGKAMLPLIVAIGP